VPDVTRDVLHLKGVPDVTRDVLHLKGVPDVTRDVLHLKGVPDVTKDVTNNCKLLTLFHFEGIENYAQLKMTDILKKPKHFV
jgi:hypothetical protein